MRKVAVYSVIFGILLVVSLASSSKNFIVDETKLQDSSSLTREFHGAAYTPHAPIVITSDADFASQGWPGDGSENTPYLIQGLNITTNDVCINVSNTDVHFKISDCFFSPNDAVQGRGIFLYDAVNGTIEGCEFEDLDEGISVEYSVDGNISNNNFRNCDWWGIFVWCTSNFVISENDIRSSQGGGVFLYFSDDNTVSFNDINATPSTNINVYDSDHCDILNNSIGVGSEWGIKVRLSIGVTIANNTLYDEFYSMNLDECEFCALENNEFEKGGLWVRGDEIEHFMSNSFENNTVESEPIAVLVNRSSETLDASAYGQLFLFNSSDCVVEDGNFDHRSIGVSLAFCTNSIVRSIDSIYNSICLVELQVCDNTEVTLCNVSDGFNAGFRILNSDNCSLTESRAMWSDTAHGSGVSMFYSYNITISDCSFGSSGPFSGTSGIEGELNTGCWIINNDMQGDCGVSLYRMDNSTLMNNDLHGLQYVGFRFRESTNLTVMNNSFHDNEGYGIDIQEDCEDIRLFNNSFMNNELGNAMDNGVKNNWDDGVSMGNHWDDYNGTGVYPIPGSAGSADKYPMLLPEDVLPTIIGPGDKEFSTAVFAYALIWYPHDNHPKGYELYLNDSLIESGSWSGESIEYNITISEAGMYIYALIVYDASGNVATDTVIVTVEFFTTPAETTTTETTTIAGPVSGENWWEAEILGMPMLWILGIGSVVVVLVIVVVLKRK